MRAANHAPQIVPAVILQVVLSNAEIIQYIKVHQ